MYYSNSSNYNVNSDYQSKDSHVKKEGPQCYRGCQYCTGCRGQI